MGATLPYAWLPSASTPAYMEKSAERTFLITTRIRSVQLELAPAPAMDTAIFTELHVCQVSSKVSSLHLENQLSCPCIAAANVRSCASVRLLVYPPRFRL